MDENGAMTNEFKVGDFDPDLADEVLANLTRNEEREKEREVRVRVVEKYDVCDESMKEYIPCLDSRLLGNDTDDKGKRFERHCPEMGKGIGCLVPAPKKYSRPIPWPRSRDEVLLINGVSVL